MDVGLLHILNSKNDCSNVHHIDPNGKPEVRIGLSQEELLKQKEKYKEVTTVVNFFLEKMLLYLEGIPSVIMITDDSANLIEVIGDETLKAAMGLEEGMYFDERFSGTNAINLCLKYNQPIQVNGDQHFFRALYDFSCSTCMFEFLGLKGTISLMTQSETSTPLHLCLISSAVESIERELLLKLKNKQLKLLNQTFMNITKDGIIITNKDGEIIEFNDSSEKLTGYKKEDLLHSSIFNLKSFSPYIDVENKDYRGHESVEIKYVGPDSREKVFILDKLPIFDNEENFNGTYIQFKDITERIMLEEQVIRTEKLAVIGELSAGLAHELRNPLTPIRGFIQLLQEKYKLEKDSSRYIRMILDELDRMKELIDQFVIISKPEVPIKKATNILQLVEETISLMENQAKLKNINLRLINGLDLDQQEMIFDKNQIKQTLINIIQNAMEEMISGEIKVKIENTKGGIHVIIQDEGKGIKEEDLTRIFDPFYTTKEGGTGLGLSVCSRIIQNHNGTIKAKSTPGKGTTFTIFLPCTNVEKRVIGA